MDIRTDGPPGPPMVSPPFLHHLTGVHRCTPTRHRDRGNAVATRCALLPDLVVVTRARLKGYMRQWGGKGEHRRVVTTFGKSSLAG